MVSVRPPLFFLATKSENRNGNCEQGCEGKLIPKKLSLSDRRGIPSHPLSQLIFITFIEQAGQQKNSKVMQIP